MYVSQSTCRWVTWSCPDRSTMSTPLPCRRVPVLVQFICRVLAVVGPTRPTVSSPNGNPEKSCHRRLSSEVAQREAYASGHTSPDTSEPRSRCSRIIGAMTRLHVSRDVRGSVSVPVTPLSSPRSNVGHLTRRRPL